MVASTKYYCTVVLYIGSVLLHSNPEVLTDLHIEAQTL